MSYVQILRYLMRAAVVILTLMLSQILIAADTDEVTIQKLIEKMLEFKNRFESNSEWLVEYSHNREYHTLPPGFKPNMKKTKVINARKGEWWYLSHEIENQGRIDKMQSSWKDKVCAHRDGGTLLILPDMNPNIFERCYYTNTLFLNIHSKTKFNTDILARMFSGASPYAAFPNGLPDSVERDKNAYKIKSLNEFIDGDSCVVIERENRDIMWLDLAHGGVCRRRIEYFDSGKVRVEYNNKQLKEFANGLWLPQHQETVRYNSDDTPVDMKGKIRYIERNDLIRMQFGNIPASLFDIKPPYPGYVNDTIRGHIYRAQPPNTEPEKVLAEAASQATLPSKTSISPPVRKSWMLIGANICVIATLLLIFQIRRIRKRLV